MALAANASGVVVEFSPWPDAGPHGEYAARAARWENGVATDLGKLPDFRVGLALVVNASGQVAGHCRYLGLESAVRWTPSGQIIDFTAFLAPSFAAETNFKVLDLNEVGQILGRAFSPTGSFLFFATIPTPGAAAVLVLGGLMVARLRRR